MSKSEPKMIKQPAAEDGFVVKVPYTATMVMDKDLFALYMYYSKQLVPLECMWYALIDRVTPVDTPDGAMIYAITDLFIPQQIVGPKEVETASATSMQDMWQSVRTERGLTLKELGGLMTRGRCWCHSHVNMPPRPSHEDDVQWAAVKASCPKDKTLNPVGMIIFNVLGQYTNRIYDPELRIEFQNVQLYLRDSTDTSYIDDAVLNRIEKKKPPEPPAVTKIVTQTGSQSTVSPSAGNRNWTSTSTQDKAWSGSDLEITFPAGVSRDRTETQKQAGTKTVETGGAVNVAEPGKARTGRRSLYMRQYLPTLLLADLTINNALISLETLMDKVIADTRVTTQVVAQVDKLNNLGRNPVKVREGANKLIDMLVPMGVSRSQIVLRVARAMYYITAIRDNHSLLPSELIEFCIQEKDFASQDPMEIICSFFECDVIYCEQMFLFAYAIAKLPDVIVNKDEAPTEVERYLRAFITASSAVRTHSIGDVS